MNKNCCTQHFIFWIKYGKLLHNCIIFISKMPHNGFIYEASMDMMENSGHWSILSKSLSLTLVGFKNCSNFSSPDQTKGTFTKFNWTLWAVKPIKKTKRLISLNHLDDLPTINFFKLIWSFYIMSSNYSRDLRSR